MARWCALSDAIGVEVSGLELTGEAVSGDAEALCQAFAAHGLVVVRNQQLDKQRLIEATRLLGQTQLHPIAHATDPEAPEILVVSSHGRDGDVEPDEEDEFVHQIDWHTDLAYVPVPNRGAFLYSLEIPLEGGLTGFIDRQKTYDALPEATKTRIEGLTVVQSWKHAQEIVAKSPNFRTDEGARGLQLDRFPDLACPLVFTHPGNGRKVLNVTRMWSSRIVELPGDEGQALLGELIWHSLEERFVYWHHYSPGDLVIWDNLRAMHAASGTRGRHRRLLYRTTIRGDLTIGVPVDALEEV
jgi:taurine dioxygenase